MEANTIIDPVLSAQEAGLRYVDVTTPGITRHRAGKGFSYRDANGNRITDKTIRKRIASLAIPPAWNQVWICPTPDGHIQATGRDDKNRKQYRYHPKWREVRDETKYERMLQFGQALPEIRRRVDADLRRHGLPREKVLAAIVNLLETTLIRVGNDQYAKANKSFGLTTMRDRHVDITGTTLEFEFRGKSGVQHEIALHNPRLARIVKACQDLPGQHLFQYLDADGQRHAVGSDDVNAYLKEITGRDYTAKDFRTWAGTVLAAQALAEYEVVDTDTLAKKNVVSAIQAVAARLGNTTTICRKCYVHPAVIDAYLAGDTVETVKTRVGQEIQESIGELPPEEAAVLVLLHHRLEEAS